MKQILTLFAIALFVSGCIIDPPPPPPGGLTSCSSDPHSPESQSCLEHQGNPNSPQKALVVGNGNYEYSPLPNPTNDARDMTNTLVNLGFYVTRAQNLDKQTMDKVIKDFSQRLSGAKVEVALFYFSGHGAQVNGKNFLIPTDNNKIKVEDDLEKQAVSTNTTLAMMEKTDADFNIMILDACRDNPYRGGAKSLSRGLARWTSGGGGTVIAHAADSGQQALEGDGNGLYTKYLLKELTENPHRRIDDLLIEVRKSVISKSKGKQKPWTEVSISELICLGGCRK